MKGYLAPYRPDMGYPLVTARGDGEFLAALYVDDLSLRIPEDVRTAWIVNASHSRSVVCRLPRPPVESEVFDACGKPVPSPLPGKGLCELEIPRSGLLRFRF